MEKMQSIHSKDVLLHRKYLGINRETGKHKEEYDSVNKWLVFSLWIRIVGLGVLCLKHLITVFVFYLITKSCLCS